MTSSATAILDHQTSPVIEKEQFKVGSATWAWAIGFMLSLSCIGLSVFPMALFTLLFMIDRFIKNRYDFMVMVLLLCGTPGMLSESVIHFKMSDPILALSFFALIFYRKNMMVRKITWLWVGYVAFMVGMSMLSDETFAIQVLTIRTYASVIAFIVFLWMFANKQFDFHELFKRLIAYSLVICVFYILDGFVFQGWIMIPGSYSTYETPSAFYDLHWFPFRSLFPRKYPSAIQIILLTAYPLARYYKLKWWQWGLIILAFGTCRTMTFIAGFFITYVTFQGRFLKTLRYFIVGIALVTGLYFIDASTGEHIRVKTTVDQFISLNEANDDVDVSEFGTGRMEQILPKLDALIDQNCLWQGFGFIHPEKTKLPRYEIRNEYYSDISKADEVAAYVEVTQFNTILHTGIIGLIVQCGFYIAIFFLLKPGAQAQFYGSAILAFSIAGIGGYGGLTQFDGLIYVALSLAVAILDARSHFNLWKRGYPPLKEA